MSSTRLPLLAGLFASLVLCGLARSSDAQETLSKDSEFDDLFGFEVDLGSDDESDAQRTGDSDKEPPEPAIDRKFDGRFTLQQELSYNVSSPASIETNRSSLQLEWNRNLSDVVYVHADAKYNIYWNDDTRIETGDSIDDGWNIRNVYLQKTWGNMSAAVGHQIIILGESETSVVADVFSPRNQSDFIFTSLEESRLSQLMLKVDQYTGLGHFTFLLNPFPKVDETPQAASVPTGLVLQDDELDLSPEFAIRWKKVVGRGDYSVFLANLVDNAVVYQFVEVLDNGILVDARYNRYSMFAGAANYTFGNSSVQTEFAYNADRSFQTSGPFSDSNDGIFRSDQFKLSLGLSHTQDSVRTWTFGVSKPLIFGSNEFFNKKRQESTDIVFSVSESFLHETLDLGYTLLYGFVNETEVHKITGDYQFTDNLSLGLSAFYYDNVFSNQDQKKTSVLTRLRYAF